MAINVGQEIAGVLYHGRSYTTPDWVGLLSAMSDQAIDGQSSSISGVLLVEIEQRLFAMTFGHAWQKIKNVGIEPNFGIRCVLNLAKADSLRAIRRDRIAEYSIQAIEQIPDSDGDNIERFGMDLEKDLLRGVKATIDPNLNFGSWVAGGDSFKASVDLSSESMSQYLNRCLQVYSKDDYKKDFSWVDNISPIKDEELIEKLNSELSILVANCDQGLSLCAPDLLAWDDHDTFSFDRKRRGQAASSNLLDLSHWVAFMSLHKTDVNVQSLKELKIYAYRQNDSLIDSWPVIRCLHGLVLHDGRTYLAHAGHWFELNPDFVARTNQRVNEIPTASLSLPTAGVKEKEGDYNARAAKDSMGILLLLDKKLIMHGGEQSKFEICDLFTESGHIICVKPWGGASSSLSHLFLQAKNSIQLINNDLKYRNKVRTYIENENKNFSLSWEYICSDPTGAEVVLAILRGCSKEALPFFAKLALVDCVSDLRRMRFKTTYLAIPVT